MLYVDSIYLILRESYILHFMLADQRTEEDLHLDDELEVNDITLNKCSDFDDSAILDENDAYASNQGPLPQSPNGPECHMPNAYIAAPKSERRSTMRTRRMTMGEGRSNMSVDAQDNDSSSASSVAAAAVSTTATPKQISVSMLTATPTMDRSSHHYQVTPPAALVAAVRATSTRRETFLARRSVVTSAMKRGAKQTTATPAPSSAVTAATASLNSDASATSTATAPLPPLKSSTSTSSSSSHVLSLSSTFASPSVSTSTASTSSTSFSTSLPPFPPAQAAKSPGEIAAAALGALKLDFHKAAPTPINSTPVASNANNGMNNGNNNNNVNGNYISNTMLSSVMDTSSPCLASVTRAISFLGSAEEDDVVDTAGARAVAKQITRGGKSKACTPAPAVTATVPPVGTQVASAASKTKLGKAEASSAATMKTAASSTASSIPIIAASTTVAATSSLRPLRSISSSTSLLAGTTSMAHASSSTATAAPTAAPARPQSARPMRAKAAAHSKAENAIKADTKEDAVRTSADDATVAVTAVTKPVRATRRSVTLVNPVTQATTQADTPAAAASPADVPASATSKPVETIRTFKPSNSSSSSASSSSMTSSRPVSAPYGRARRSVGMVDTASAINIADAKKPEAVKPSIKAPTNGEAASASSSSTSSFTASASASASSSSSTTQRPVSQRSARRSSVITKPVVVETSQVASTSSAGASGDDATAASSSSSNSTPSTSTSALSSTSVVLSAPTSKRPVSARILALARPRTSVLPTQAPTAAQASTVDAPEQVTVADDAATASSSAASSAAPSTAAAATATAPASASASASASAEMNAVAPFKEKRVLRRASTATAVVPEVTMSSAATSASTTAASSTSASSSSSSLSSSAATTRAKTSLELELEAIAAARADVKKRLQANARAAAVVCSLTGLAQPVRSARPLTLPEEFDLRTAHRSKTRSVTRDESSSAAAASTASISVDASASTSSSSSSSAAAAASSSGRDMAPTRASSARSRAHDDQQVGVATNTRVVATARTTHIRRSVSCDPMKVPATVLATTMAPTSSSASASASASALIATTSTVPRGTVSVKPFHLLTEERGALHRQQLQEKLAREEAELKQQQQLHLFKPLPIKPVATEVNDTTKQHHHHHHQPIQVVPFNLHTEARAALRSQHHTPADELQLQQQKQATQQFKALPLDPRVLAGEERHAIDATLNAKRERAQLTAPKTPNFRIANKPRRQVELPEEEHVVFKAQPVPAFIHAPTSSLSSSSSSSSLEVLPHRKHPTAPAPFNLESERKHAEYQAKLQQKLKEAEERQRIEAERAQFRAKPILAGVTSSSSTITTVNSSTTASSSSVSSGAAAANPEDAPAAAAKPFRARTVELTVRAGSLVASTESKDSVLERAKERQRAVKEREGKCVGEMNSPSTSAGGNDDNVEQFDLHVATVATTTAPTIDTAATSTATTSSALNAQPVQLPVALRKPTRRGLAVLTANSLNTTDSSSPLNNGKAAMMKPSSSSSSTSSAQSGLRKGSVGSAAAAVIGAENQLSSDKASVRVATV